MKFPYALAIMGAVLGRAPQGARGLKFLPLYEFRGHNRRAPQGARGLKCSKFTMPETIPGGRAPQGARGLKCICEVLPSHASAVAPRKGRVG